MTLHDKIKHILAESLEEAYPGMGRNRESESPSQGGSKKPSVEVLNKGVQGGSTPNKSAAPLAAGAGPMDKTPPKQGDSQDAGAEELDGNKPGTTAGKKAKKMPVLTNSGYGKAQNFSDTVDPVSAIAKRAGRGNVHQESSEDLDAVEDITETTVDYTKEIESLFAEEDGLSEDFKVKAASMFAALVEARVSYEMESLEEEIAKTAAELVQEEVAQLTEKLDAYLNTIVEQFIEENQIAFEQNARTEIAESFMDALRDVFEEHYITIPEGRENVLEELMARVESLEEELSESREITEQALTAAESIEKELTFLQITEGMTDLQREKLAKLVENVEYGDAESFSEKVRMIAENYSASASASTSNTTLSEDFDISDDNTSTETRDPMVSAAMSALTRTLKK